MAKIKYTKNELKNQKKALKRFTRYLPTLVLKKQQLQLEIQKTTHAIEGLDGQIDQLNMSVELWAGVFADKVELRDIISVKARKKKTENIAGIDVPVFAGVEFDIKEYDLITMPLWVDYGIEAVKRMIELRFQMLLLKTKQSLLAEEMRVTTQRVNLFEKIKIPESREYIRKINITLGDMQTAAVVTGKIAKHKIEVKHAVA
jgi:V/A-type H+/Na+-transporting ATPase subunit D